MMARDYEERPAMRDPEEPQRTRGTFSERVAALEAQVERLSNMVADLGEHAATVAKELDLG